MSDSADERSIFCKRMQKTREEKNMSIYELSKKTGINKSVLGKYESGKIATVPPERIKKIADALKVNPAYLVGWERAKTKSTLKRIELLIKAIMICREIDEYDEKTQGELWETIDDIMDRYPVKKGKLKEGASKESIEKVAEMYVKLKKYSTEDLRKMLGEIKDFIKGVQQFKESE